MNQSNAAKLVYMGLANFPHLQSKDVRWEQTVKLWSLVLEDSIPYERAERALVKVLRTAKFFPTAGEVREAAISLAAEDYTKRLEAEHRQHLLEATGRDGKRCSPEENLDEIAKMRIRVMGQK